MHSVCTKQTGAVGTSSRQTEYHGVPKDTNVPRLTHESTSWAPCRCAQPPDLFLTGACIDKQTQRIAETLAPKTRHTKAARTPSRPLKSLNPYQRAEKCGTPKIPQNTCVAVEQGPHTEPHKTLRNGMMSQDRTEQKYGQHEFLKLSSAQVACCQTQNAAQRTLFPITTKKLYANRTGLIHRHTEHRDQPQARHMQLPQ